MRESLHPPVSLPENPVEQILRDYLYEALKTLKANPFPADSTPLVIAIPPNLLQFVFVLVISNTFIALIHLTLFLCVILPWVCNGNNKNRSRDQSGRIRDRPRVTSIQGRPRQHNPNKRRRFRESRQRFSSNRQNPQPSPIQRQASRGASVRTRNTNIPESFESWDSQESFFSSSEPPQSVHSTSQTNQSRSSPVYANLPNRSNSARSRRQHQHQPSLNRITQENSEHIAR